MNYTVKFYFFKIKSSNGLSFDLKKDVTNTQLAK